jgi:uncharacterized protein DUF4395
MARNDTLFSFPDPVNDVSARLVAGAVVLMSSVALVFRQHWILFLLAYGFVARVLTGPTLSPLGLLATRVITPRLGVEPRYIPGPPKRFAQGIGAAVTLSATFLYFVLGWTAPTDALLGLLIVFALMESALGFCVGCRIFTLLMRAGVIPEAVCPECLINN